MFLKQNIFQKENYVFRNKKYNGLFGFDCIVEISVITKNDISHPNTPTNKF